MLSNTGSRFASVLSPNLRDTRMHSHHDPQRHFQFDQSIHILIADPGCLSVHSFCCQKVDRLLTESLIGTADATYITGFGLVMDPPGTISTSPLVTGKVYASDYISPTPSKMITAIRGIRT
jgi:hypothetical protein